MSWSSARQDLAEVFALHAAGRTRVVALTRKLDDVNDSFTEILNGSVPAAWSSSSDRLTVPPHQPGGGLTRSGAGLREESERTAGTA